MRQVIVVALLVCALPLFGTEPNPSKKQADLIGQLIWLTSSEKTSHAVLDYYVDEMYKQEVAAANGDPLALEDAKKDAARMRELIGQLNITDLAREETARIYAKYLNEADLEALVAFYKTAAAQKYVGALPQISQEVMKVGADKIGPKLMEIFQQVAREREERHPWVRTMRDIRILATAVEAYETDTDKYPQESELKKVLVPTYIKELPEKDGWGNAYSYTVSPDGKHYRIASAGSDGVFSWDTRKIVTVEAKEPKYSEDLADDIIYQDGEMLQVPAVTKPRSHPQTNAAPPDAAPVPAPHP
ncbi:MAG TPA: DUF2059 domain-containing protein [Thermoanaerobaculia bacterium]